MKLLKLMVDAKISKQCSIERIVSKSFLSQIKKLIQVSFKIPFDKKSRASSREMCTHGSGAQLAK
jgi:hypothetical protein